jgi:hypothetical protein
MSEFYPEPEMPVDQELALLRARIAIYVAHNDALKKELESLKDKNLIFAARVRQLEFEMMVYKRMNHSIPDDASSKGGKPGL